MDIYLKLRNVATKHYPNETNYCGVIALAVATGWRFGKARSVLFNKAGRRDRQGTHIALLHRALKEHGYKAGFVTVAGAKTLVTAQKVLKNTKGTYFVYTKRHVTTIKDGVCEDWSHNDRGTKKLYRVESIFKIEKE
jgi:hypothetical protein|tara:strand:+ start:1187 stop:1597 length:411 start_codon:yes stop_codon:yes gene_type:complete